MHNPESVLKLTLHRFASFLTVTSQRCVYRLYDDDAPIDAVIENLLTGQVILFIITQQFHFQLISV